MLSVAQHSSWMEDSLVSNLNGGCMIAQYQLIRCESNRGDEIDVLQGK